MPWQRPGRNPSVKPMAIPANPDLELALGTGPVPYKRERVSQGIGARGNGVDGVALVALGGRDVLRRGGGARQ